MRGLPGPLAIEVNKLPLESPDLVCPVGRCLLQEAVMLSDGRIYSTTSVKGLRVSPFTQQPFRLAAESGEPLAFPAVDRRARVAAFAKNWLNEALPLIRRVLVVSQPCAEAMLDRAEAYCQYLEPPCESVCHSVRQLRGGLLALQCGYMAAFGREAQGNSHAKRMQARAAEVLAAYHGFFDHIGLRKGWRTAPFSQDEVRMPFWAAAQAVTLVRAELDRARGEGVMVLRQVEGSAMGFLWGWPVGRQLNSPEVTEEFVRGLVFATLSDGRGLVEGLDNHIVEKYLRANPYLQR